MIVFRGFGLQILTRILLCEHGAKRGYFYTTQTNNKADGGNATQPQDADHVPGAAIGHKFISFLRIKVL